MNHTTQGQSLTDQVLAASSGAMLFTVEDFPMIVSRRSFAVGTDLDTILDETAIAEEVVLTADGRGYVQGDWHDGDSDDIVFVERWDARGRVFHGWLDRQSRRLVQAG